MRYLLFHATILPILLPLIHYLYPTGNNQLQNKALLMDIPAPEGFQRKAAVSGTFAAWLRQVSLKTDKTVYLFNGTPKRNQQAQYAVIDMPVGKKDLQQCADAVMRLRAEYLYSSGRYEEITFYDNLKKPYQIQPPYTRDNFENYLEWVFTWCGTLSLEKQLKNISNYADVRAGDVFIHGGSPGHAVMVMDVAVNAAGEKVFMLAQSYMPAQDIHILKNPANPYHSPWYSLPLNRALETPEWNFKPGERKQW